MDLTAEHLPAPAAENNDEHPDAQRFQFQFHGKGGEYFRIWIVNMSLTIVTLGIYSAWAKVRKNRYIYGSLELDGSHFDYLAKPMQILRGRLIAIALLVAYVIAGSVFPLISGLLAILVTLLSPWLIVRSRMFNMRYTAYRNIRFSFLPAYSEAVAAIIGFGLLSLVTLGLGIPYAHYRRNRLIVDNTRYGNLAFSMDVPAFRFFLAYGLSAVLAFALLFPAMSLLEGMGPIAGSSSDMPQASAMVLLPILTVFLFYFVVLQFMRAYVLQITTKGTRLRLPDGTQQHTLGCEWSMAGMLTIYVTNMLAIIISFGLLIPWAQMRIMRYQLNHTWLEVSGSIDSVVAGQSDVVSSIGEEIGDVFDVDIGL